MIMNSAGLAASSPQRDLPAPRMRTCARASRRRSVPHQSGFPAPPLALQAALADVVGDVDVEDGVLDGDVEPGLVVVGPGDLAFDHERVVVEGVPADGFEDRTGLLG